MDDYNIRNLDLDVLRSKIAVVLQDVFLYNTSILENITIGNKNISREQVIESAKKVGVHEFIMQLPNGYDFEIKLIKEVLPAPVGPTIATVSPALTSKVNPLNTDALSS